MGSNGFSMSLSHLFWRGSARLRGLDTHCKVTDFRCHTSTVITGQVAHFTILIVPAHVLRNNKSPCLRVSIGQAQIRHFWKAEQCSCTAFSCKAHLQDDDESRRSGAFFWMSSTGLQAQYQIERSCVIGSDQNRHNRVGPSRGSSSRQGETAVASQPGRSVARRVRKYV